MLSTPANQAKLCLPPVGSIAAGVPRYLLLLNVAPGAREAVDAIRHSAIQSGDRLDAEIAALLAQNNWRPQLVGAVAILIAGANDARLAALWGAIDRPCWTSPQLVAAASLVDVDFEARARMRLDRRGALDARDVESMPWPARHSALGPGSIQRHSAKVLAALLRVCEQRASATHWIGPYAANEELRRIVATDADGGGFIAATWRDAIAAIVSPVPTA